MTRPNPENRWSWVWPVVWACIGAFVTILAIGQSVLRAFYTFDEGIGFVLLVLLFFGLTPWLIPVWLGAMGVSLWHGRWKRLVGAFIAPLFGAAIPYAYYVSGVWPRFLIERPRFEREIATLAKGEPRYREFHWDETGFAGSGNTSQYIVYDETDAFPDQVRTGKTKWSRDLSIVTPMGRHFFLIIEVLS
ncbi:MAG: hypothetical protein JO105_07255 [Hyphomicrobiales bacterium]|nr:hypothetical protein [Hyphomicrobiales bacterium]